MISWIKIKWWTDFLLSTESMVKIILSFYFLFLLPNNYWFSNEKKTQFSTKYLSWFSYLFYILSFFYIR